MTSLHGPPVEPQLVDFAVDLVRTAGQVSLPWFRSGDLAVERKADDTPVTAADRAVERLVRERLADAFPDDTIVGEEEPDAAGTSGRRWIVDPIDGTIGFTRGVPLYSTLLAMEDEHGPAVGVVGLPALGETVYAARGRGCWLDDTPVRVSDTPALRTAYVTSSGYAHWPDDSLLRLKATGCSLGGWGDGYGYALVATGRVDAMVDPAAALHDLAAMPVILSEAGGLFTAFDGTPHPDRGTGVATNGHIHPELLDALTGP